GLLPVLRDTLRTYLQERIDRLLESWKCFVVYPHRLIYTLKKCLYHADMGRSPSSVGFSFRRPASCSSSYFGATTPFGSSGFSPAAKPWAGPTPPGTSPSAP